ncbi:hypothetical protein SUGI_0306990 [Cryptomeria japonica]|nr:hypothetical protein SUGI_0306990 [Cryptomeria japonica]
MQNEIEGRNNEIVQHEDLTEQLSNANEEIRILKEQNESLKNELEQANERMMKSQTDLDQLNEQNLHKQKGKAGLGYNEEGESSEQGSQRNQRPTCNYCEKSLTELNVTEHGKTADLTELAMTSTSTTSRSKAKKTSNMLVKGVKWTAPNFKLVLAIAESLDPSGAQSRIPSKAAIPRVAWVKPLPYEINIDEPRDIIEALINEPTIPNTPAFGSYDEAKARIELEIKLPKAITSTKRKAAKEIEETKEESEEEAKTPKKKGKVVITKPKLKTVVFTRRTRKGQKKSEVVFRKPPPTFEEKLKQLEQGSGMSNFKALKYESRSDAEKMQIEELLLNKMGKWKYTPDDINS